MEEENFIDLLDQYLDLEELEMKKANDYFEVAFEYKKHNSKSAFDITDTITIDKYVNDYLGIVGDCSNMYHSGLKDLNCSYVMGVDNGFANKNPELVKEGYLLLVLDARGKRGTYINPFYLQSLLEKAEASIELKVFAHKMDVDMEKLDDYYNKYIEQLMVVEKDKQFYNLLKQTHKVKQFSKLFKRERGNKDEKY